MADNYDANSNGYVLGAISNDLVVGGTGNVAIGTSTPVSALTVNGAITAASGTPANPTHSFSNGSGDGMYLVSPDFLGFATAGTNRLTISSSGNVGIGGLTAPTNKLQIYGGGTNDLYIPAQVDTTGQDVAWESSNGTGNVYTGIMGDSGCGTTNWTVDNGGCRLQVTNTGNVGIGTTVPSTTLQVAGASSTIRIGTSALPGCLEMGNSNGSAGINYVTFLNGVMTATTTKPSACQ
jgi:hypothetical protein